MKLKACPFCLSQPAKWKTFDGMWVHYIGCQHPLCLVSVGAEGPTAKEAAAKWNKRERPIRSKPE